MLQAMRTQQADHLRTLGTQAHQQVGSEVDARLAALGALATTGGLNGPLLWYYVYVHLYVVMLVRESAMGRGASHNFHEILSVEMSAEE